MPPLQQGKETAKKTRWLQCQPRVLFHIQLVHGHKHDKMKRESSVEPRKFQLQCLLYPFQPFNVVLPPFPYRLQSSPKINLYVRSSASFSCLRVSGDMCLDFFVNWSQNKVEPSMHYLPIHTELYSLYFIICLSTQSSTQYISQCYFIFYRIKSISCELLDYSHVSRTKVASMTADLVSFWLFTLRCSLQYLRIHLLL